MSDLPQEVRISVQGKAGVIAMDRPRALNSHTIGMLDRMLRALDAWKGTVERVLVCSARGGAFSAGGDIRWIREQILSGNDPQGDKFFDYEYAVNLALSEFPGRVTALVEGVDMGGGMGVSAHGDDLVITENAFAAMPEVAIGFIPDAGLSHRLTRLKGMPLGMFLGLTGWRLSPADMLWSGLATQFINSSEVQEFRAAVQEDREFYSQFDAPGNSVLQEKAEFIAEVFGAGRWVDIQEALAQKGISPWEAPAPEDPFAAQVYGLLKSANPTSLVATAELLKANATTDLATALQNEKTVGAALRRQPNFVEGVRAVVVDKTRDAAFQPVDPRDVDPQPWVELLSGAGN